MKSIHLTAIFIFSTLLFSTRATAQHDFRPGYIVTINNDTVHGFIDYGPAQENALACNFKTDPAAVVKSYSLADLNEYSFTNGKRYIKKDATLGNMPGTYFLECLVSGIVSLYYIKNLGLEYYFIEQSNNLYELRNDRISYVENGQTYSKESNKYKGILSFVMKDTPYISKEIQTTDFNRKSLTKLVIDYHQSINHSNAYTVYNLQSKKANDTKWTVKFGVGLGLNYSFIKSTTDLSIDSYERSLNLFPPPNNQPIYPIILESNMPNILNSTSETHPLSSIPYVFMNVTNNSKNSLQIELNYLRNKIAANGSKIITQSIVSSIIYKRGFRYYKKIKPFLDFGLSFHYDFAKHVENLYIRFNEPYLNNNKQVVYKEKEQYVSELNSNLSDSYGRISFIGGLGLAHDLANGKKLELELRGEKTKQYFSSNFDNHIFTVSAFHYLNFVLIGRIAF